MTCLKSKYFLEGIWHHLKSSYDVCSQHGRADGQHGSRKNLVVSLVCHSVQSLSLNGIGHLGFRHIWTDCFWKETRPFSDELQNAITIIHPKAHLKMHSFPFRNNQFISARAWVHHIHSRATSRSRRSLVDTQSTISYVKRDFYY